mgnify:CR=1 FL=1
MDKEYRQYIENLAAYCRDVTFHGEYSQTFRFAPKRHPGDGDSNTVTKMTISVDHVYLNQLITVYPETTLAYKRKDYKQIGKDMLHEICHTYFQAVWDLFVWDQCQSQKKSNDETVERQVQRVAVTIYSLLPRGWYLPSRLKKVGQSA